MGPIITQSGPKVRALIIISSHDRKIKELAPAPLLSAAARPDAPGYCSLLTEDFRKTLRGEREPGYPSSVSGARVLFAKPSLNYDVSCAG